LATLTDEDLTDELGCTTLQARKIRRALSEWGVGSAPPPAAAASGVSATSAAVPAEPAPSAPPMPAAPAPDAAAAAAAAAAQAQAAGAHQRLSELGSQMQGLEAQAAEAARGAATYGRGSQLLSGATAKLHDAMKALGHTQAVGAFQTGHGLARRAMFGVPGRFQNDFAGNMIELATLRRANSDIQTAANAVHEASGLLGQQMPRVDERALASCRAGLFQNMLFGGAISDVMQMAQVKRSMEMVQGMTAEVQAAAQWASQNAAAHQQREAGMRQQLATMHGEYEALRRQLGA
jgi:hypothetical protein